MKKNQFAQRDVPLQFSWSLYEVLPISDGIRELILNEASAMEIKAEAIREGMKTLRRAGITKIKEGVTTVEEVVRCSVKD